MFIRNYLQYNIYITIPESIDSMHRCDTKCFLTRSKISNSPYIQLRQQLKTQIFKILRFKYKKCSGERIFMQL